MTHRRLSLAGENHNKSSNAALHPWCTSAPTRGNKPHVPTFAPSDLPPDTKSADSVFELMRQVNRDIGTSFLLVTHNLDLARRCDRIIEVVDGRVPAQRPWPPSGSHKFSGDINGLKAP